MSDKQPTKKRSVEEANLDSAEQPVEKKQEVEKLSSPWHEFTKSTHLRFHISSTTQEQFDKWHFEMCDDFDSYKKWGEHCEQRWDEHILLYIDEAIKFAQMSESDAQLFKDMVLKHLAMPEKRQRMHNKMDQSFRQMCAVKKGPEFVPKTPETLRHAALEGMMQVLCCEVEAFAKAFL